MRTSTDELKKAKQWFFLTFCVATSALISKVRTFITMQNTQKAKVTWVKCWGFAPGGGFAYMAYFQTVKTLEEGCAFVFSNTTLRVEDFIFVKRQGEDWNEVENFDDKYLEMLCE